MDSLHQSRNLSVNQTLDEILGIASLSQSDTSSSSNGNGIEKNSVNSTMRPPTRHGRESAGSSNEENKDPINIENGNIPSSQPTTSSLFADPSTGSTRRHSEDEFFKKLNDIRRRSLVSAMDMPASTTTSISIHPESPKRESVRPRLEIHVEEAEPVVPVERETSGNSLEVSDEPQSLTFRVDDKSDKSDKEVTDKKEISDKKVPKLKFSGGNDKLPPKRPPAKKEEKAMETAMMQRSMFNTANSKPSDAHHKEWLAKKEKEIRDKKKKEKEAMERKTQTEKERRENSAKLYQRWVQDHDEKMKKFKEIRDLKTKEKKEKVKMEKETKRKEAEKNFQMWKQERSRSVTDLRRKLEEEEEKKRRNEELDRQEKQKEAQEAFLAWKRKKEEFLSEDARKQRREEREKKQKEEEYTKEFKLMCATEAYETWMEMKDKEREMLADLVLIEAPPIPWIPPSNLVPRQFIRSSQGNRPKRSQSAKSIAKRSRSRPSTTTSLRPFR